MQSPGQYVIYNGQTGERLPVNRKGETKKFVFEGQIRQKHPI
jgi:hypothetical protein